MRVRVLGSSAGGGLPQWNCGCANCVRARGDDPAVPARNQASIAVSVDGQRWSLLNASPDIRQQLALFPGLHPHPQTRELPLDSIIVTNADLDHVLGLLILREALPYRVHSTPWVRDALLNHNALFRLLATTWCVAEPGEKMPLDREGRLEARFFPVAGKVPPWLHGGAAHTAGSTSGVRITDAENGARLVYVPGARSLDAGTWAELEAADCLFFDGTFFRADELGRIRPGAPDAIAMGHSPIGAEDGSLARLKQLSGRCFYIHINNTNPILDANSPEAAEVRQTGVEIAHDGLEIEL